MVDPWYPWPVAGSRVSVVVRCHNYGRFLAEALTSVAGQTRPVDEVVVVDDGSTDETGEVLEEWRGPLPLVVVSRHPARGPARSFNDGVAASTGDLVVALDADDRFSPELVERLAEVLDDDPGVDFAYGGERRFGLEEAERPAVTFDVDELMRENFVHVSAMFRRWIFEATGGFRPEFDGLGLEDWEFWVAAVERGAVGRAVDGCWLEYRRHAEGSRNTMPRARVLRAHLLVWRLHPRVFRPRHLAQWMARSARRQLAA